MNLDIVNLVENDKMPDSKNENILKHSEVIHALLEFQSSLNSPQKLSFHTLLMWKEIVFGFEVSEWHYFFFPSFTNLKITNLRFSWDA